LTLLGTGVVPCRFAAWEHLLELDDHLKKLMHDLGVAINDALANSTEINEAIQNVREAGYDVFLLLEATIGVHRRASDPDAEEAGGDVQLKVNAQDMKFLKSLKIKVDDLDAHQ
jgi:hypothetical protein